MARPLRLALKNGFYHVIARGNRKDRIFFSPRDKYAFLEKMNEAFDKYAFICLAYCLMENHYHLFVRTPEANLSQGMHALNAAYANWVKAKHEIVGSIFQGRFKSFLVDGENYAVKLSAYIHLNPIRAGLVADPRDYAWSSFPDFMGMRRLRVHRLETTLILGLFGDDGRTAIDRYEHYVHEQTNMENPCRNAYRGFAIGSPEFLSAVKEMIQRVGPNREIPMSKLYDDKPLTKADIFKAITERFGASDSGWYDGNRLSLGGKIALYFLNRHSPMTLKDIGEIWRMDYSAVHKNAERFVLKMERDPSLRAIVQEIEEKVGVRS